VSTGGALRVVVQVIHALDEWSRRLGLDDLLQQARADAA